MDASTVSFDTQTLLVSGSLLLIGCILAAFAMVTLFLAWRSIHGNLQRALAEIATLQQAQEAEHLAHTQELETKQNELTALHSQFDATQEDLTRRQTELESSNQRAKHLQSRTELLERAVADQKLELADLTNQLAQADADRDKIAALEALLQTTRGTAANLSDELRRAQEQAARATALEAELQTTHGTLAQVSDELALARTQAARAATLETELESERGARANLASELTHAHAQAAHLATLSTQRASDQSTSTELSHLRAQVETDKTLLAEMTQRLNQTRQRAERVISDLESEKMRVAELTQKLHETQQQTAELVGLRNQVAQHQVTLSDLTSQLEQARTRAAQADALEVQAAKHQTRAAELKSHLTAARKKAAPVTRLKKNAQKNRAQIADLRKQVRLTKQQIKILQAQSKKHEMVIVDLTTRLYRVKQEAAENLEIIKGIGPRYAARLRTDGITTLNALAHANVAQLQEIIQPRRWQKPAFESWIRQARQLTRRGKLSH